MSCHQDPCVASGRLAVVPVPVAFLLLVVALMPPQFLVAQSDALQSPVGAKGLALVETADGYHIEDGMGLRRSIQVAAGTRLSALRELDEGWLLTGEVTTDEVSELTILHQSRQGLDSIVGPGSPSARYRMNPEPMVDAGRLVGLAWLESDDRQRNAVRSARWTGEVWEQVETVAAAGPAAQLALSAAVLEDGSWLLVWAAYLDGDDDVLWSRRENGRWSAPRRLNEDNSVPDIVPRVVAVPGGALAAWSSFDGSDYRLRLARFNGGEWLDTGFEGEKGSLFPTFVEADLGVTMLYKAVVPRSWVALDLAADGQVRRRAATDRWSEPRPIIFPAPQTRDAAEALSLRWVESSAGLNSPESRIRERRVEWAEPR